MSDKNTISNIPEEGGISRLSIEDNNAEVILPKLINRTPRKSLMENPQNNPLKMRRKNSDLVISSITGKLAGHGKNTAHHEHTNISFMLSGLVSNFATAQAKVIYILCSKYR